MPVRSTWGLPNPNLRKGGGVGPSVYSEDSRGGVYEGEVTMRLNKRGSQALLAFDIQGVVSSVLSYPSL